MTLAEALLEISGLSFGWHTDEGRLVALEHIAAIVDKALDVEHDPACSTNRTRIYDCNCTRVKGAE